MTGLPPILKLVPFTTIQGFLKRHITLSWVNWLRYGESSKFNEEKKSSTFFTKTHLEPSMINWLQFDNFFEEPLLRAF